MDLTLVLGDERTRRIVSMEVGFFDSSQEIKEEIEKITGIPTYRQTLLLNSQVLQNEAIIFNTDISEASCVHLLDADFDNHAAPPNSNHHDEITDMHADTKRRRVRRVDAVKSKRAAANENEEMPQSTVEELQSSIPDAPPPLAPQTPKTVTENALPPRNPEFTPSPPAPPPPLHEAEITPGGSVSDERNPKE